MDWLKELLEKATVTDGKLDADALMKAISAEFPKHAVPKEDFNNKVKELNTANETIKNLKQENGDNEELQKKIGDYETEIKNLKKSAEDTTKTYALKEQLTKSGVLDPDYLIYKAGGIDKFTFDKDNRPVGVDDVIKPYKEDKAMAHLFQQEQQKPPYHPQNGGTSGNSNPFAKETYNLTKQGELLKANPEQARAMAAAAGVTI
ncbi:phage scaffolding protein [Roseburia hominis]|uniref:phage scaffolding protein n=1 Tax=Roseburia hominis TaxID=301301 RepID=UPI001F31D767|nr:phage scaffolding protein [Roseburia hominis]